MVGLFVSSFTSGFFSHNDNDFYSAGCAANGFDQLLDDLSVSTTHCVSVLANHANCTFTAPAKFVSSLIKCLVLVDLLSSNGLKHTIEGC